VGTQRFYSPIIMNKKNPGAAAPRSTRKVLSRILGCKWSFAIYPQLRAGVRRPGALEKAVPGISAKVLNECLRKNVELGLLEKIVHPEIPPRVEYHFTEYGMRFLEFFSVVERFQREIDGGTE
jgi:DNA-binding HxlR family transcriptional regulator